MADVSTAIAAGITIVGALGGSIGYFAKARGDSIIKYQAIEITNRDQTIARIEKDNAALLSENNLLHEQNKKLSDLAQGSPQLKKLTDAIATLTRTVDTTVSKKTRKAR